MYSANVLPIFDHIPLIISFSFFLSIFPKPISIFFLIIFFDLKRGPKATPNILPKCEALLNPIILLNDHGTIGGYPKIGVVISADLDRVTQLPPGANIKFKEVTLEEAENLFKEYLSETRKYLNAIN